jgi:hypothetical protein
VNEVQHVVWIALARGHQVCHIQTRARRMSSSLPVRRGGLRGCAHFLVRTAVPDPKTGSRAAAPNFALSNRSQSARVELRLTRPSPSLTFDVFRGVSREGAEIGLVRPNP